ncbi:hypothetical protein [Variovorax boronicumulans]|uniref:hypothetical protein n=1 Tax=Variovorax boronicumulans TaxID=436515 RepID=UPI00339121E1
MVAMLVGALGIACAGSGVSASYATVQSGAGHRELRAADVSAGLAARPWWSAFQSETLDALIAQARRDGTLPAGGTHPNGASNTSNLEGPATEVGVSAAYVALLVQTLSLTYIDNARAAAQRQSQLMAASPAVHDDFSRELARREATARTSLKKIDAMREVQLADLALRARMPAEALQKTIADEVAARRLPHFAASLPQALPAVLLANRDDIQLAASLYGIEPRMLLAGTIRAAGQDGDAEDGSDPDPDAQLPGYPLFPQAVAQGRAEVAEALRRLQARSGLAAAAEQRAREAKAMFEMSKTRLDRREISEVQMLEDFQGLMLDQQRLAAAHGDLAIAWIGLMASLGSRTPVVLRASPARDAAAALRARPALVGPF